MRAGIVMAVLVCVAAAAQAGDEECGNMRTQQEMNACATRLYDQADRRLNALYARLLAEIGNDAGAKARLRDSERAWIAFRDAQCGFESAGYEGGSIQPLIRATCMKRLTDARIVELQTGLDCRRSGGC